MTLILAITAVSLVKTLGGRVRRVRDPARSAYERYCRRLRRVGLVRTAGEGPRDFGLRARQARPDLGAEIATITRCYVECRYGERREALAELKARVARFRPRSRSR